MLMSSSLAWYRVPWRPPIRVGIAHVCGSAIRRLRRPRRIWMIGAGSDSKRALGMLHWNAALILAGSSRVIGWRGAPPELRIPAVAQRFRRFRVDQSWPAPPGRLDSRRVNARR